MVSLNWRELKKGTGYLFGGQALQSTVAFGVNLVLVRFLFPEDFGHFAIVMAGGALAYAALSLRLDAMTIRASNGEFSDQLQDRYFTAALYETFIASVIFSVWLYLNGDMGVWEFGLMLALAGRHWAQQNKGFFERKLPYRKLAILESSVATCSYLFALCLVLFGAGPEVLFLREFFLTIIGIAGMWWIGGITIRRVKFFGVEDFQILFQDARGLWLDGVLENCFGRIVILLVGEAGGERAAGYFLQAQKLAMIPHQLIMPVIGRVAWNWFARVDDKSRGRTARDKLLSLLAVILIIPSIICVFAADQIVPFVLGENWARSANLLVAMSGMVIFATLFDILRNYCLARKLIRWLLIARIMQYVGAAVPIVLYYLGLIEGDFAMALCLSTAFALAFFTLLAIVKKTKS